MLLCLWLGFLLFYLFVAVLAIRRGSLQPQKKVMLLTRDNEEVVEGIVREAAWLVHRLEGRLELAVMDCGSHDDTPQILRRLKEQGLPFELILSDEVCGKKLFDSSQYLEILRVFMYRSNPHRLLKEIRRQSRR